MFSKAEKNYLINIALGIAALVCILSGFLLKIKVPALMPLLGALNIKTLHEGSGYLMTALVVVHILTHVEWIRALSKKMFAEKLRIAAALTTVAVTFGICIGVIVTSPKPASPDRLKTHSPASADQQYEQVDRPL